jgi:glycosyltransferase involved in cell wall biosynthesis
MVNEKRVKSCLIISYGPVPTPQYQTVEGGGMRVWGLAKGLAANGIDVTIGINNSFPQNLDSYEQIKLINWGLDESFAELINSYDSVLISYCMGDPSVFVVDNISDDVQLILDAYVPIYIEVSARKADNMSQEYKNYFEDFKRHNHVLKRGDYFLCANETQKFFYTGALSSLGIINPYTYKDSRLLIVPFGIHNIAPNASKNPYKALGIDKTKHKTILWFGGLYPWFRVDELLNAIKELSDRDETYKFVFVGGKNPFNANPDLLRQYEYTVEFSNTHNLLNKSMYFVEWVDFDERINWYKHADFAISINQPGEENVFSWRTRVMDYVWGELVTITNGGDPLSETLLKAKAAMKLEDLSTKNIVTTIESIYSDIGLLEKTRKGLIELKSDYYWNNVTQILSDLINTAKHYYLDEKEFQIKIGFVASTPMSPTSETVQNIYFAKAKKVIKFAPRAISYARRKGVKQSTLIALTTVKNQGKKRAMPHKRQYVFLSHPLDNSGAPQVLVQVLEDLVKAHPHIKRCTRVIAPSATKNRRTEIRKIGVQIEKAANGIAAPLTGLQLSLKPNDFVFLNTVAVFDNYRNYVFNLLSASRLKHAYWFIHEDIAQTNVVAPQLLKKENIDRIHKLIESGKITILVPSKRVRDDYNKVFDTTKVRYVDLRIDVNPKYLSDKSDSDYEKIDFLLSGTASDGRKGQLIALPAFQKFLLSNYAANPAQYRDFSVHFVGVNEDYISHQIKSVGKAILGKRLHIHPSIPREEAMAITSKCNAVICCSLNETFALYVAEGMAMGHVVLRNNTAGIDEQLVNGENGYFIDSENIEQFAEIIEKILNKNTENKELQKMGKKSQQIAAKFLTQDYSKQIDISV